MPTRPNHNLRSKPRAFRQTRILIVGCGQVGQRLLQLHPNHHFIATYQPSAAHNAKRLHLRELHAQPIALNHQNKQQLRRVLSLARRIIWLAPPNPQGNNQELLRAGLYVRQQYQRYGGITPSFTYVSTTGVYGNTQGAVVDELSPVNAQTPRAKRRAQAEQHLKKLNQSLYAHSNGRMRTHILRAPGIYSVERLPLNRLQQGLPAICAEEDSWSNHIHEIDLARLCLWVQFKATGPTTVNACDQQPCLMGDYFDRVADWAKLPRPPRLSKAEVKTLVSPMMWSFMEESRQIISKRQPQLGFVLRYPNVSHGLLASKKTAPSC